MDRSHLLEGKKIHKYPPRNPGSSLTLFTKQIAALEFFKERNLQVPSAVFALEIDETGKRQFLFSTLEDFWRMYQRQQVKNFYEVIRSQSRSKLYLDLEFNRSLNPEKNGHLMLKTLIAVICKRIHEDYGFQVEDKEYLLLDASNEQKFSVHVIFFSVFFESNLEVGKFVREVMKSLSPGEMNLLQVQGSSKMSTEVKTFCDLRVYNKHQNFRLFLSSKFNQDRPLVLSKNNAPMEVSDMEIFRRSIISNCEDNENSKLIILSGQSSCDRESKRSRLLDGEQVNTESSSGPFISPVEKFIMKISAPGRIRHKKQNKDGTTFYNMTGANFCRIKNGDHHSGSQIYFVYSEETLYQKCFSEKCLNKSKKKIDMIFTE